MVKRTLPSAKITLSCPLWACDFVPQDASQLIVGGGGGAGRHGVGNKITLLKVSSQTDVESAGELELSAQEDSVATIAVGGPRNDKTNNVFAGINGTPDKCKRGESQHFRIFSLAQHAGAPSTSLDADAPPNNSGVSRSFLPETARETLFASTDADTFQRRLRLSQPFIKHSLGAQLGAVSTGFAKQHQIAIFNVPAAGTARWKPRGRLEIANEAMDLDVIQTGPDTYQLAYCDDNEIFTVDVSKSEVSEPKCVYTLTGDVANDGPKPSFRSLRYLSPGFVFAVANNAGGKGVALHGYRLPKKEEENARLAVVKHLPKSVSRSTGLAIRNLTPPDTPSDHQGESQYVVAVSGQDSSISLFTLEYQAKHGVDLLANLAPFHTIESAHPQAITGLNFSTFTPPEGPRGEVSLKLASVSLGQTAVVHSIPLKKHVDKSASPTKEGRPVTPTRYVVAIPSKRDSPNQLLFMLALMVLAMALIGQVFMEATHLGPPVLGTNKYLPASWTRPLQVVPRHGPVVGSKTFGDLLKTVVPKEHEKVIVRHEDLAAVGTDGLPILKADIHNEEVHGPAKSWDEMETHEQRVWRERLKKTGHWAEEMGETVLKGVVFGEIGGAIGAMVGEAL
ncbi:hypothetical protein BKA67DRAFT_550112 [Truncatella angustata]|uniref:Guanine nucleotide-exchange factor SEC12 n=1 Tax=Truncatella angustata TaxID=152316 RepID=A0A9P8UZ72_9PEZI|nr:uncharacterized protein BKA67DRAFT_550112 [Truncatella angustata]KAH6661078.1 hypothetical protein BKA67DRAFT_550112 [Truncatella angustata]